MKQDGENGRPKGEIGSHRGGAVHATSWESAFSRQTTLLFVSLVVAAAAAAAAAS